MSLKCQFKHLNQLTTPLWDATALGRLPNQICLLGLTLPCSHHMDQAQETVANHNRPLGSSPDPVMMTQSANGVAGNKVKERRSKFRKKARQEDEWLSQGSRDMEWKLNPISRFVLFYSFFFAC